MITKDRKLAQERGHYDPSKIARIIESGGDRMKVEKGNTGGDNITVEFIEKRKLTKLKILNEGEMDTYEPQKPEEKSSTRLLMEVSYEDQAEGDPKHWRMNNKSRNALIDVYGDDTKDWIGKEPEITLDGTGDYRHIMVDTLRTK